MGARLTLEQVRRRRAGRDVLAVPELEVGAGERLGVLGANGAGKTTLLRLLAGLDSPDEGTVRVDGSDTRGGGAPLRRRIGYAPQRPALLTMSVERNVALPLRYRGIRGRDAAIRSRAALALLGVEHLAGRPAHALSGGEAQRVSLARTLVTEPAVLLLDEPAAALDPAARAAFLRDLDRVLAERDATVVHVSHRPDEVLRSADRVAVMVDGHVVQCGRPADVLARPASAAAARLLGYENVVPWAVDGRTATVAVWAAGVRIAPAGDPGVPARVTAVATSAGRWDVSLRADGVSLAAHVPLTASPPTAGADVAVSLDPAHAALVPI